MGGSSHKDEESSGSSPRSEGVYAAYFVAGREILTRRVGRFAITPRGANLVGERCWCSEENLVNRLELASSKRPRCRWDVEQTSPRSGSEESSEEPRLSQTVCLLAHLI